ncbi:plastid-lipid-associated protein 6, chloroplastic [Rhodamnia argentea]|uniref:Plastid-lipid-associated protein 6, chloroplastic n=1 Tax=Rhodamnia argentea TaxID=178133 RepID=A0A8B8PIQ8_9MYRT|nr:plastid-lipid-associated protein 6, chloroplastic [Rhodamnia argentea]XP_048127287.1 plastid-lipid-associated protein 6, chloroplastic [Rhodamnia argentea]XP_048127291.1 plastid-lipid-associated protein 6, chloroplastic [Rhodamnia argentea]
MASSKSCLLLPNPTSFSHSSPSSSSASSVPRAFPSALSRRRPDARRRLSLSSDGVKRGPVTGSSLDEVSVLDPPPRESELLASLKLKLLSAVSGLNRGLAASEEDLKKAEAAAKEVEDAGGLVDLSADLDKLQGQWKLIYSSAFSARTLGGSRPGPPTGRLLPITLGQVFQRIDVMSKDFDNIAELKLGAPWPLPPVEVTATLAHKFELIGSAKIKITFEKTTVKTMGNLSQLPPIEIPRLPDALRPPSTGSGEFEVTYLDSDVRITRGDRAELRVFVIS